MAQTLRKFISRAPRYVLRTNDNQVLRFAANRERNRTFSTRFVNISETGLAFVVDRMVAPAIGETIKLEFPVPGGEQIAWFAKVVRLEEVQNSSWWTEEDYDREVGEVLVGVQFHELPDGHRNSIRIHLQEKFQQVVRDQRLHRLRQFSLMMAEHGWKVVMWTLSAALTFSILYYFSRPSPNYDAKRGAPWGERFK